MASTNCCGCSSCGTCPHAGNTTSSAPGSIAASRVLLPTGTSASAWPWMMSTWWAGSDSQVSGLRVAGKRCAARILCALSVQFPQSLPARQDQTQGQGLRQDLVHSKSEAVLWPQNRHVDMKTALHGAESGSFALLYRELAKFKHAI